VPSGEGGNHPISFVRDKAILHERGKIKKLTIRKRRLQHQKQAA